MRTVLVAALATAVHAFSSSLPEELCFPIRDCQELPAGWATDSIVAERQYSSTKTAAEVWAHVQDHEVFFAGVNCKVIKHGFFDKNGVGAVRAIEDNNGFKLRQIIYSVVEESHYSYRNFASCGPLGSFASSQGFCNATLSMNQTATGWKLSIRSFIAANDPTLLREQLQPAVEQAEVEGLEAQDAFFSS